MLCTTFNLGTVKTWGFKFCIFKRFLRDIRVFWRENSVLNLWVSSLSLASGPVAVPVLCYCCGGCGCASNQLNNNNKWHASWILVKSDRVEYDAPPEIRIQANLGNPLKFDFQTWKISRIKVLIIAIFLFPWNQLLPKVGNWKLTFVPVNTLCSR